MPFVETPDGASLFYRDWGQGRPVLFCSAVTLSSAEFQHQMLCMADHDMRAIAYDRRGHGRSDDPGQGYDYDTLADDLALLIDHLDLRALVMVAHSMAGGEVIRYLTRHGDERVDRIVLIAATLPFLLKTPANPEGIEGEQFEATRAGWRRDYGRWLEEMKPGYFGDGLPGCEVSGYLRDWTMADIMSTSFQAIIDCNHAIAETDFRAEMRNIRIPALIIHGDHDRSVPIEISGLRQAELLPKSRLIVYENGPHGLYLTHGERLNEDLLAFAQEDDQN